MNTNRRTGAALRRVVLALLVLVMAPSVQAASNVDGYIYGEVPVSSAKDAADLSVTVENAKLGIRRQAKVDASGSFRASSLPIGLYQVTLTRKGKITGSDAVSVSAGLGARAEFRVGGDAAVELDELTVTASPISPIDFSQTEAVTVFSEKLVDEIPVPRAVTNVALLAPGTVQGDSAFSDDPTGSGALASFGGASVAENAYFVNGFNITDFRRGTGFTTVPFEFLREFQVKTGGYGAEFGRSIGGVVNTITKRGGNVWEGGVNAYYEPDSLRDDSPNSVQADGTYLIDNRRDQRDTKNYNLFAGGPAIRDDLYVFGLINLRDETKFDDELSRGEPESSDQPFYGAKVDWNILDDHLVEFTAISDERENIVGSIDDDASDDNEPGAITSFGQKIGTQTQKRGGQNLIARYTGRFGDFSISGLVGNGSLNLTDVGDRDNCPRAIDRRSGPDVAVGCWVGSGSISKSEDERTAYRLDAEYPLFNWRGNHVFRFGADLEDNKSFDDTKYSGDVYYRYQNAEPGAPLGGSTVPADVTEVFRLRHFRGGGNFATKNTALYVEDTWTVNDALTFYAGLRNETFDNRNKLGGTFIKITNQPAPRLGFSWDAAGTGVSRVFGNFGRYYMPVAANTNVRLSGGEFFDEAYFQCGPDGAAETCTYAADGSPTNQGSQIGSTTVYADGSVPDVRTIVDQSIKPMFQDEFIIGYQSELDELYRSTLARWLGEDSAPWLDRWLGGIRVIYRELQRSLEDVTVNHALREYAVANGLPTDHVDAVETYILTNPGTDITMAFDFEEDGVQENVFLPASSLNYPKASRRYNAVEMFFERQFDGIWFVQGSYTWSQSYGNNEGYVRSDNGQSDAGITTTFDYPGLTEGSRGYLPNDRRHKFKLYGAYSITREWQAGANLLFTSGRPINAFGVHPTDAGAQQYGAASFYDGDVLVPRGSRGRTSSVYQMDLSGKWMPAKLPAFNLGLDVFNVLGSDKATEVYETVGESGARDPRYKLPQAFQDPRFIRLSAQYNFFF